MKLTLKRDTFGETTTLGKLYVDGEYFCETLEDKVRPAGEKIDGATAIPAGMYNVELSLSSRFGRVMLIIFTDLDKVTLRHGGVTFKGVRFHGGNTHKDTHGCPLVAYNRVSDTMIQGSAEKELTALIKDALDDGDNVILQVS